MPIYLEYMGYSVEVPHGETVIGRHATCALRFNDSSVSRKHARLLRAGNDVFVEDLGSTNGTTLNGKLVLDRTRLADGDVIDLGGYSLELRIIEPAADEISTRRLATLVELGNIKKRVPTVPPYLDPETRELDRVRANRRTFARCTIEIPIVYTSRDLELEVTTRDLSMSGVFVSSQVLEPVGTSCELTIRVTGLAPLHVRGVVRRVVESEQEGLEPVGLGIEFVELGPAEASGLANMLAHLSEQAS